MKPFAIEETQDQKTAWIYPEKEGEYEPSKEIEPEPGRVALKISYWPPKKKESLFNRLIAKGIMKRRQGREPETVKGREHDRNVAFAEELLHDWRGLTVHGQKDYTPELGGILLSSHQDIYNSMFKAVEDIDLFFVASGNGSSGD